MSEPDARPNASAELPDLSDGYTLDTPRLLRLLARGTMREARGLAEGLLRWSSNATILVALADSTHRILAVYKPQRGERPLWDFPDGTLCCREMAAFVLSNALGWRVVPPTVLREGPRGLGSVQLYIPHDPEVNYFSLPEGCETQLQRMSAFDYVINNADRKGGHCLLDQDGHLWGIDHGIGFHATPKLRTVIWDFAGQPVPEPLLIDLERVYCEAEQVGVGLRQQLDNLLARNEVESALARMRKLLQRREFPRPGPGPNYPWPPV
jgi:uncharacterized repeat protein (TIGR03843 family)